MSYQCRVERDSINNQGDRLISFVITFPRRVLAEVVTHRRNSDIWGDLEVSWCERTTTTDISKNSASSRAIPLVRMINKVTEDPFYPFWTANQRGMQGDLITDPEQKAQLNSIWDEARLANCEFAARLGLLGAHKQDSNRLLEPFVWITQVVTSSRWDNFFSLRCHEAADPHLRHIARLMYLAKQKSTPEFLDVGQWHLPFVNLEEQKKFSFFPDYASHLSGSKISVPDLIKFSAARCAWISYESHDKDGTEDAMLSTFERLMANSPVHASPSEHQVTPADSQFFRENSCYVSNLTGYVQHRKLIASEQVTKYEPTEEEIDSWQMN